jgi:hypothetical protein
MTVANSTLGCGVAVSWRSVPVVPLPRNTLISLNVSVQRAGCAGLLQPIDIVGPCRFVPACVWTPHTPLALAGALGRRPPGFFSLANTTADAWLDARSPGGSSA